MTAKQTTRLPDSLAIEEPATPRDRQLVGFDGPDGPTDPLNCSAPRKWTLVTILALVGLIGNLATLMCIPAIPQILAHFNSTNVFYATTLASIWELGQAVDPLLIAPSSEVFGRAPAYNAINVWFIVMSIACRASKSPGILLVFRLLNGMGDPSQSLNASIVGDMFPIEKRGLAVPLTSFPPLLGPVAGPIVGDYLTQAYGWRWAFRLQSILGAVCAIAFFACYRVSYAPAILRTKARRRRDKTGDSSHRSEHDSRTSSTRVQNMLRALTRPVRVLTQSPIVFSLALHMSIEYAILYLLLTILTPIMENTYEFTQSESGLAYLGISTGMTLGALICALNLDRLIISRQRRYGSITPEARLPPMIAGTVGVPTGLLLYGWSAKYHVQRIVPLIGTATVGFAIFVTTNYSRLTLSTPVVSTPHLRSPLRSS